MPILKNCLDRFPLFEGCRMLAKQVQDSIELWKARAAGSAVMPAEREIRSSALRPPTVSTFSASTGRNTRLRPAFQNSRAKP